MFNGTITTTGTVRFWISAPDGSPGLNLGLIDGTTQFGFVAQQDGNYTFNFENGVVGSVPVQVGFTYTTDPDISGGDNSTGAPLTYWAVFATITVVGSILIIVLVRRRNKKNHGKIS